ncbi:class I SAM-dependent methyltransferase [Alkalihalobacillus sp. NPDC078783]
MEKMFEVLSAPAVFEKGNSDVWTDPKMSDFVLQSHLDSNLEGASRNKKFIDDSVSFIRKIAPVERYRNIIDLGCGPGLYSEKLQTEGYRVTGVDYSKHSIDYAKEQAKNKNLDIEYRVENILEFKEEEKYDISLLIYQIFGLFSPDDRKIILKNINKGLKKGGLLLLDVLSEHSYHEFKEQQVWSFSRRDSLLFQKEHIGFSSMIKYPDRVTLQKTSYLFKDEDHVNLNYWNQYFSKDLIKQEAEDAGFTVQGFYADVNGEPYHEQSETLAVVLVKVNEG